jgi:hypothetical protein
VPRPCPGTFASDSGATLLRVTDLGIAAVVVTGIAGITGLMLLSLLRAGRRQGKGPERDREDADRE